MRSYRAGSQGDGCYLSLSVLKRYLNESDTNRSVRETCEIAKVKVEWDYFEEGQRHLAQHIHRASVRSLLILLCAASLALRSLEHTPPSTPHSYFRPPCRKGRNCDSIQHRRAQLLYTQLPLFERYRPTFALRNIGSPPAVDALESRHGFFG